MSGLLNSRTLILLFFLVIVLNDFQSRIFLQEKPYSTNQQGEVLLLNSPILSAMQIEDLEKLYAPFNDLKDDLTPKIDNDIFKENIKSDPTKLLIQQNVLELRAIVAVSKSAADSFYALISKTNLQTSVSEVVKVLNNDTLLGYRLSLISNVEVKLIPEASINADATEPLTLAMYKKHSKNSQK